MQVMISKQIVHVKTMSSHSEIEIYALVKQKTKTNFRSEMIEETVENGQKVKFKVTRTSTELFLKMAKLW
jgi:hypothetical protein